MSNSTNSNTVINNSNNTTPRDGTRVVLREITATLQNSPPMHHGIRKVASNAQPGKTEHEVKVQFTREFVDAGAPDSRPESLSSASSFQSLSSTLSTRSGLQLAPPTPQKAADTSYADADIPGLDDLIAACGNIKLNDKTCVEEIETFQSISDSTLTVTANDGSFVLQNNLQNLTQEEAFDSAINESYNLNETRDLSSDYKEALENSINSNDARKIRSNDIIENSNCGVIDNFIAAESNDNSITNNANNLQDIPQNSVDNSLLNETRNLSLNSDKADGVNLNTTVDLQPVLEKLDNNSCVVQNCSLRSNSSEHPQPLNESIETVPINCNSTFNDQNSNKSDALNSTHDLSNDRKDLSIDCCDSQNTTDTAPNLSSNELSASETGDNVSSINDPLNLPPESDVNISTSIKQVSDIENNVTTELPNVDTGITSDESNLVIDIPVEAKIVEDFAEENNAKDSFVVSEQCVPDSSTDHVTEVITAFESQGETTSSSNIVQNISTNSSEEFVTKSLAEEEKEANQIPDNHNVSTSGFVSEDKPEAEPVQAKILVEEIPKAVESEVSNSVEPELEFDKAKELSQESLGNQVPQTLEKVESLEREIVLQVPEIIVPCVSPPNLSNNSQDFEELPQKLTNVTPFPRLNTETHQNSTLTIERGSQNTSGSTANDSNETVTLKEDESFHSISSDGGAETYKAFQPVKQSTSLNSDCNFKKLELAAKGIAEEIRNESLEFAEDSEQFFSADPDLFLDTASLDFFLTRNNNSKNTIRDLRAESLYVKFDPLVSNTSMLPQGPPQVVDGEENAKNSIPPPTLDTPKRNPALAAIDRLLFYSPATGTPNKVEEPPKIEEKIVQDVKLEAIPVVDETMTKELELVRSTVLQLDSQLEKERKEHAEEMEKQRLKYKELEIELSREVQKKNEMTMVMDEYEKSLSRHMTDRERERVTYEQERAKLQEDLQAANHHLGNTEAAFNDVHSKYERLKSVVSAYKSNEDVLKESVQENVETIKTLEARYEQLKGHAMSQLEKANMELEVLRKQHETETVRLQAMIRKAELKSNSLAEMVEQKSKESKELAKILDEVIARVGHHPE